MPGLTNAYLITRDSALTLSDSTNISREDSRIIAGAVFDALRRAMSYLLTSLVSPTPETAA